MDHVVIRRPEFVAGSKSRPEVRVFVQTNIQRIPLELDRFEPGQIVWMKWTDGPIVARARILSWHVGQVRGGNINQARELTNGTNLFGLDEYWKAVSEKGDSFFVVVRLSDEEWLDRLIYPKVRTFGRSWIYLDNESTRRAWLSDFSPPIVMRDAERSVPSGMRFEVFRRDNFKCVYCGRSAPEVQLQADHKIPWKVVRRHEVENLVTACRDCNSGKSDKNL